MNANDPRVIVALDFAAASSAMDLLDRPDPAQCRVKIGKEMLRAPAPRSSSGSRPGASRSFSISNTTISPTLSRRRAAADMGVWMMNVHASGGRKMMTAAAERLAKVDDRPLLIAVTILTSLGQEDIAEIGYQGTPADNVRRLAALAQDSGLDGVVCSPLSRWRHCVPIVRRLSCW